MEEEPKSDGSSARSVLQKFTPRLSPAKQQEEWAWWIQVLRCFGDYFEEDIRLLQAELIPSTS